MRFDLAVEHEHTRRSYTEATDASPITGFERQIALAMRWLMRNSLRAVVAASKQKTFKFQQVSSDGRGVNRVDDGRAAHRTDGFVKVLRRLWVRLPAATARRA
jgi:hypothetical protein